MTKRSFVIEDPCGTHVIWDELMHEPVIERGQFLAFATKAEARKALGHLRRRDIGSVKLNSHGSPTMD